MKYSAGRDLGSLALIILLVTPLARGQAIITTVAGGTWAFIDGGPATSAPLGMVDGPAGTVGVAVDAAGNLYATDQDNNLVFKVSPTGALTVVAGNGIPRFSGDGGPATGASLYRPTGVAVDAAGSIYIADTGNGRIRKVGLSGIIGTVAGNGKSGFSGDGGPATSASLDGPSGVAVDAAGNLYIADSTSSYSGGNNRIRKVSPSGIISTVAGNGTAGFSGDGGLATNASLNVPSGIAVDAADNLYIADARNNRVRRVAPSGIISTVAGGGSGFPGGNGPATSASLSWPSSVAVDAAGNLYITDQGNGRIRKVSPSGMISTAAGSGQGGFTGDGGPATLASLWRPTGVAVDAAGSLYIADQLNNRIRKVSPSGIISTLAGNGGSKSLGDGGPATSAVLKSPQGVAADAAGNLYIADSANNRARKVDPSGTITTVAGNGVGGFSGDGGPATAASLYGPAGVAVDAAANLYVADGQINGRIRKVSLSGIIATVAGGGPLPVSGYPSPGDGGPATRASLCNPSGVAVDAAGSLYIAAVCDNSIRKVSASGIIDTVAGMGAGQGVGFSGDGGPATSALLSSPVGVAVDAASNLYIADSGNQRIRRVSPSGIISTVAGNGQGGFTGDGGPATLASLWRPTGVAVDAAGSLYIADQLNNRIRAVSPSGIISTVAGNGTVGSSGDGLSATSASLAGPRGVAVDAGGNLYIADTGNNRVRRVLLAAGQISAAGVTNAASFAAGLTPGSIVTIFGVGIAKGVAGVLLASSLPLPTTLGGISAWIGGVPAPLFAVANVRGQEQINLQVPYEITGQTTVSIQVNANGVLSNTVRVPVLPSHPGIFTVDGEAGAALHGASNALVTAANPAVANEVIAIYAAGLGPVSPAPKTGYPAPSAEPLARTATTPTVTIGGVGAPVLFSGLAPGFVGLYQVNAQVPGGVPPGSAVPVLITQGGLSSNAATIAVR